MCDQQGRRLVPILFFCWCLFLWAVLAAEPTVRRWLTLHDPRSLFFCLCCFFFVFVVVASDLRSRLAVTCMLMLVASCCLPDPLNAPLCWYVDMAPSAVGHCPLLRCRRGKIPEQHRRRLSQIIILVKRHSCRTNEKQKTHSHSWDGAAGAVKWVEFSLWLPSSPQSEGQPEGQGVPQSFQGSRHQGESPVAGARRRGWGQSQQGGQELELHREEPRSKAGLQGPGQRLAPKLGW